MREVFRNTDYTKVGYYASILESHGIGVLVKNEPIAEHVPIEHSPELWVLDDEDYDEAFRILSEFENGEKKVSGE